MSCFRHEKIFGYRHYMLFAKHNHVTINHDFVIKIKFIYDYFLLPGEMA